MRIGKNESNEIIKLEINTLNKHGVIAGSSGSGKTTTIKTITQQLNNNNINALLFDAKGDIKDLLQDNQGKLYTFKGNNGIHLQTSLNTLGIDLLSNILDLNITQIGILTTLFLIAQDNNKTITTISDLEKIMIHTIENNESLSLRYGRLSNVSINTIRRKINTLKYDDLDSIFNYDTFNFNDIISSKEINVIDSVELVKYPKLYASIVVMILQQFYQGLEDSTEEQPKTIIFIDESHLLFNKTNKNMIEEIERIVKLIRSKGIGLFFISQSIYDIENNILNQLTTKIQHQLHLMTTKDYSRANSIGSTFTSNNKDRNQAIHDIKSMQVGKAFIQYENNQVLINDKIKVDYIYKSSISDTRLEELTTRKQAPHQELETQGINTLDKAEHAKLKSFDIFKLILLIVILWLMFR